MERSTIEKVWEKITICLVTGAFLLGALSSVAGRIHASAYVTAWASNGIPICTAASSQTVGGIVIDGAGGAIVAWTDGRAGNNNVYAQRVNSAGTALWAADGTVVCNATGNQFRMVLCSDGSGAIIAWQDFRTGGSDIYTQRISAAGVPMWQANGIKVCSAPSVQGYPKICTDMNGGVWIAWEDYRTGSNYDIYAQHVNASGASQLGDNGTAICTFAGEQDQVEIASDGLGGVVMVWVDARDDLYGDAYAQRVNSAGSQLWGVNGILVSNANYAQVAPRPTMDGQGGAIIAWVDSRDSLIKDIYAQRIDSGGSARWLANGTLICNAFDDQDHVRICSDQTGGAIISWIDERGSMSNVYAQRVDSAGTALWAGNGTTMSGLNVDCADMAMSSDGSGGAVFGWNAMAGSGEFDIFTQQVIPSGLPVLAATGLLVCEAAGDQANPNVVMSSGSVVIVAWDDNRNANLDVYAQRVRFQAPEEPPADNTALIVTIVVICAVAGGVVVLYFLDKKKIIDLRVIFGKLRGLFKKRG